jgi:hypothetical protein
MPPPGGPFGSSTEVPPRHRAPRELYIDVFRGLMALVMVQGHVFDTLLTPLARAQDLYRFQQVFHGSTAPGFLFASGFVAGLPRAPLSVKASLRRARRLIFVWAVGYLLTLPYFSLWKILNEATPSQQASALACDALQVIAASQLFVLLLQWIAGRRWVGWAGLCALLILAGSPFVWASDLAGRVPLALGAYLDWSVAPSQYPVFPFAAFVLCGTVAGSALGRVDYAKRKRRSIRWGLGLVGGSLALTFALAGRVDFWGPSPAYALLRLGGLLLLLRLVESATSRELPGTRALALLGHETLLVYVLHLVLLFGGILGPGPLLGFAGQLGFAGAGVVLVLMLPVLLVAARAWHGVKVHSPHEATLALVFLGVVLVWEFLTRPW